MQTEFNPTKKDLLNLDSKILDLKLKKQEFVKSKLNAQNSLIIMQSKYQGVQYNSPEFNHIKEDRKKLKIELQKIELEIKGINDELKYKNKLKNEVVYHLKNSKTLEADTDKTYKMLIQLKEKYNSFSKDRTRVSSMRIMASEFKDEIEKIIKSI